MIFPTLILLVTLATIQAKAPTTCPAVDSQTSVYIPDEDCSKFWQCSNGTPYLFDCPAGLHFNPTLNVCDWPQNVNCVGPKELCDSSKCPAVDGPNSIYHPTSDCSKFCQCSNGVAYLHNCPSGLEFNPVLNVCDWPENAGCSEGSGGGSNESNSKEESEETISPSTLPPKTSTTEKVSSSSTTKAASSTTEAASSTTTAAPTKPPGTTTDSPKSSSSINPTTSSSTTAAGPSTGNGNNNDGLCDSSKCPAVDGPDSVYQPTEDCTKFCQCSNGVAILHNCPEGLDFNPILNVCDWPEVAGCSGRGSSSSSSSSAAPTKPSESTTGSSISSSSANPTTSPSTTEAASTTTEAASSTTTATPTKPAESTTDSSKSSSSANPTTSTTTEAASSTTEAASSTTEAASSATTEAASSTTTVTPSTESGNNNEGLCDSSKCPAVDGPDSVYQPTEDCTKFCQCSNGVAILHNCPEGLDFNRILNVCDYPEVAGCRTGGSSSTSSSTAAPTKPSETTTDSSKSSSSSNPTTSSTTEAASTTTEAASSTTTATPTKPAESTTDSSKSSSSANPTTSATTEAASSTTEAATKPASSTTALTPSTGSGNNNDVLCDSSKCPAVDGPDSVYQPTEDCTKFCQCSNGVAILHNCPEGLDFNPILNVCDWPEVAGCRGGESSSSSSSSAAPTKPSESTTDSTISSSSSNPTSSTTTEAASTTTTAAPTKPAESTTDSPKSSSPANPTTSATTKAASPTTEAASSTTTVAPSTGLCDSSKCPAVDGPDSVYQPTKDCTKFCQCSNGVSILHNCPAGLEFNPVLNVCDWPQNAGCSGRSSPSPSTAKPTTSPATEVPSSTKKPTKPTTSTAAPSNGRSCDSSRCPAVDGPNSVYLELDDCTKFCQCSNGVAILHKCPKGLHFSSILNVCDWPEVAGCKKP